MLGVFHGHWIMKTWVPNDFCLVLDICLAPPAGQSRVDIYPSGGSDIHGPQRMNPNDFGDPLAFPTEPRWDYVCARVKYLGKEYWMDSYWMKFGTHIYVHLRPKSSVPSKVTLVYDLISHCCHSRRLLPKCDASKKKRSPNSIITVPVVTVTPRSLFQVQNDFLNYMFKATKKVQLLSAITIDIK